jgi:PAS domain S-box-containing protein
MARSKVTALIPLVVVCCILMVGGILLVLRKTLRNPVRAMVAAVSKGECVEQTGLTEFDIIGTVVNDAFQRLKERTEALQNELIERIRAQEEIRTKDQHIRRLLSFTEEGIFGIDLDGICTFSNSSCISLLGYEREEQLLGVNIHDLIHHSHPDGTPLPMHDCLIHRVFRTGGYTHIENEVFWRSDGSYLQVEYWSHPINENGAITGAVVTFIDISQRKLLEDQLIQAQKMESIGRLAGGVAHDFNNPLTPIIGYSELIKKDLSEDEAALAKLNNILKAADGAKELVHQLLSFSRKQVLEMKTIDLNQVLSGFQSILRRTIRESIDLRICLTDVLYGIRADRNQIEQVVMNLVVNAQDAIGEHGVITIETAPVLLDDEYASQHIEVTPGHYLMLAISDDGCGMNKETRLRVFEPFFTTKGVGKGTGLGLATVYGIVRQHGGNIWVYSEPNKGTTFKCYFPIVDEKPINENSDIRNSLLLAGEQRTILLVEDNEMVRTLVDELLTRQGFNMLVAEDPIQALKIIGDRSLDLLITDVVMPHMSGLELHTKLLNNYPGLKVLYMSGYASNAIAHQGVLDEGTHFIQKPFAITAFAQKVENVLIS